MTTKNEKVQRAASVGTSIGNIGGLTYAFMKKKKFWGYVGYFLLFGIITGSLTYVASEILIKENDENPE